MPKTNAVINMKDINGKKTTKAITDISNNATNQQILDFAQGLVGVTNNYYDYTNKVVTTKVDSEGDKPTPTFTGFVDRNIERNNMVSYSATFNGDAPVYFQVNKNVSVQYSGGNTITIYSPLAVGVQATITAYAPETDNFRAYNQSIVVTLAEE